MKFSTLSRAIVLRTIVALGALTRDFRSTAKRASVGVDHARTTVRAQAPILIERLRTTVRAQAPFVIARLWRARRAATSIVLERSRTAIALATIVGRRLRARSGAFAVSFVAHAGAAWVATRAAAVRITGVARHACATVVPELARWGSALLTAAVRAVVAVATRCRLSARRARLEIRTAWLDRPRGWSWPRGWVAANLVLALACVVFALRIADNLLTVVPLPPPPRPVAIPVVAKVEPVRPTSPNYDVVATRSAFHPDRDPSRARRDRSDAPVTPVPKPILFGVVVSDEARLAYLEDPVTKQVFGYKAGDALAGGRLESIDTDRVTIRRGGMLLEVMLQGRTEPRADSRSESRRGDVTPAALPRRDRESVPPSSMMPPLMPPTTWGGSAFR